MDCVPTTCERLPLSGLSAVGRHSATDIAPFPTFAVTRERERDLGLSEGRGLADWARWDEPACAIQVMRYELDSIGEPAVDPLSAVLSLADEQLADARVERAAIHIPERILGD